ncbi:MAG TPA: PEP-CTERM sorting domain-containing protein [Phycisphaerae bacterium]|nr:PEP-CTERM sorting domain-containing protein [Phycisphaerae bacterium]
MKHLSLVIALGVLSVGACPAWAGSVAIDPAAGWGGWFSWNGLGRIDGINGDPSKTGWALALTAPGKMTLATTDDLFVPGDEFALHVDGVHLPWTSEYYDISGCYHGEYRDLALSAGAHSITLYVTALATGYPAGDALASFSKVVPPGGGNAGAMPEPVTMVAGLLGLAGVAGYLRHTRRTCKDRA